MDTNSTLSIVAQDEEIFVDMASARVAIVEDMRYIADLIVCLCERWKLEVTAVAHTCADGYEAIVRTKPDFVLLDLQLPDADGVVLAGKINAAVPSAKIIIVSAMCSDYFLHRLGSVRIKGFIDKSADRLFSLLRAIEHIQQGGTYFATTFLKGIARLKQSQRSFFKLLTDREQEVLLWVSQSLNDDEIAEELDISASTVQTHRKEIMRKLDIHSASKLIRHCYDLGMLPLSLSRN